MKKETLLKISGYVLLAALGACGGNSNPYDIYGFGPMSAGCSLPAYLQQGQQQQVQGQMSIAPRRVHGKIGNSATLVLDIYQDTTGAGTVYGIGQLAVASLDSLYGYSVVGQTNGAGLTTAVCSKAPGTLQSGGTYENISMVLVGNGVQIELGNYGTQPYLSSEFIEGTVLLQFTIDQNRYYPATFTLLRD